MLKQSRYIDRLGRKALFCALSLMLLGEARPAFSQSLLSAGEGTIGTLGAEDLEEVSTNAVDQEPAPAVAVPQVMGDPPRILGTIQPQDVPSPDTAPEPPREQPAKPAPEKPIYHQPEPDKHEEREKQGQERIPVFAEPQSLTFDLLRPIAMDIDMAGASSAKPDFLEPLRLDEAVARALSNNDEIGASKSRYEASKLEKWGAYSQYLPSVEAAYAVGAEISKPGSYNDSSGDRVDETTHNRRDRSLFIRQPLVDLATIADIARTDQAISVADAELRDTQEQTAFSTVKAYLRLLQARRMVEIADGYKKKLHELGQRMQARFDEGGATNVDVNRIRSRMNVAEAARLQAIAEYGTALSEFRRLTKVVPARLVLPKRLIPLVPRSIDEALAQGIKTNPTYRASMKKIDQAEAEKMKNYAGVLPKVSAEMSNAYVYNAGGAAHGNPIDGVYPTQDDTRFMLVAKWSLTGGTQIASARIASEKAKEMRSKAQDVKARMEEGLLTAYDALSATRRRQTVLKDTYQADFKIVEEVEDQFTQGQRSLFELLDAHDRFFNSKMELLKELFIEATLSYQIRYQTGGIARAVLEKDSD